MSNNSLASKLLVLRETLLSVIFGFITEYKDVMQEGNANDMFKTAVDMQTITNVETDTE